MNSTLNQCLTCSKHGWMPGFNVGAYFRAATLLYFASPRPFQKMAGSGGKRKMIASIVPVAVQTFSR